MVDGPNVYAYVGDNPIIHNDKQGLRLTWPGHPADPRLEHWGQEYPYSSCFSHAYDIAEKAKGWTTSIRHCVAICEANRCLHELGGLLAQLLNIYMESQSPSTDSSEDVAAGKDALNITVPDCADDNYCTTQCQSRGW
jgi:hypothetical protein